MTNTFDAMCVQFCDAVPVSRICLMLKLEAKVCIFRPCFLLIILYILTVVPENTSKCHNNQSLEAGKSSKDIK